MNPRLSINSLAIACAMAFALPALAQQEGAQVLFSSDKLTVVDANGKERVARQGDFLNPGDRVITPPGGFSQLRLPDGTLISARPGSDFKLERIERQAGKNILSLEQGHLRVINAELPNRPQPSPIEVVTPISILKLSQGDGETIHIRQGDKSNLDPGTYNRLQTGVAVMSNKGGDLPLQPTQSAFVPRPEQIPASIPTLPLSLARFTPVLATGILRPPPLITSGSTTPILTPTLTTSVLTNPTLTIVPIAPIATVGTIAPTLATVTPTTGTLSPTLTSPTLASPTLTPALSATLQPAVITMVPTTSIITAVTVKPPPPPPPPPPSTLLIRTTLIKR